jgi:hypothetical protein
MGQEVIQLRVYGLGRKEVMQMGLGLEFVAQFVSPVRSSPVVRSIVVVHLHAHAVVHAV